MSSKNHLGIGLAVAAVLVVLLAMYALRSDNGGGGSSGNLMARPPVMPMASLVPAQLMPHSAPIHTGPKGGGVSGIPAGCGSGLTCGMPGAMAAPVVGEAGMTDTLTLDSMPVGGATRVNAAAYQADQDLSDGQVNATGCSKCGTNSTMIRENSSVYSLGIEDVFDAKAQPRRCSYDGYNERFVYTPQGASCSEATGYDRQFAQMPWKADETTYLGVQGS